MSKSKFICNLPWEHISVQPHGHSLICCEANFDTADATAFTNGKAVNIKEGIEATINSDHFKTIRKDMTEGKIPVACQSCWKIEQAGGKSKRNFVTQKEIDYSIENDGSIKVNLKNVELRLGNYCNLKCRACNAESSTSWISDYMKLKDKIKLPSNYSALTQDPTVDYSWTESNDFYDDLVNKARNMELLQISGGEPFLVDKHSYLIERLVEEGIAKNLTVSYITNANYDFNKVKPILDKLKLFKSVNISISLDDIKERNDYIRSLSNWELTIENIKKFINNYNYYFSVTQTFNVFSFLYAEELYNYLKEEGIKLEIRPNHVLNPEYLNANILPKNIRQNKINSIKNLVSEEIYNSLTSHYYNQDQIPLVNEFLEVTNAIDKIRKENFSEIFPELFNILKKNESLI